MRRILIGVLFLIFSLFLSGCISTSPISEAPFAESNSGKIQLEDVSKDEAFVYANEWMAETFVDSEMGVRFSGEKDGKLIGNHLVECPSVIYEVLYRWNITIQEQHLEYQYELISSSGSGSLENNEYPNKCEKPIKKEIDNTVQSLKNAIQN